MASPAAKGSAAEAAAGAAVAAAATLPLVSEEVASAPAPSDMAQRMMCVSWLCVDAALFRRVFSVYCGIVVPYSAAQMCQLADALRFGHVGACYLLNGVYQYMFYRTIVVSVSYTHLTLPTILLV